MLLRLGKAKESIQVVRMCVVITRPRRRQGRWGKREDGIGTLDTPDRHGGSQVSLYCSGKKGLYTNLSWDPAAWVRCHSANGPSPARQGRASHKIRSVDRMSKSLEDSKSHVRLLFGNSGHRPNVCLWSSGADSSLRIEGLEASRV